VAAIPLPVSTWPSSWRGGGVTRERAGARADLLQGAAHLGEPHHATRRQQLEQGYEAAEPRAVHELDVPEREHHQAAITDPRRDVIPELRRHGGVEPAKPWPDDERILDLFDIYLHSILHRRVF